MPDFNNLNDLFNYVNSKSKDVLEKQVAPKVKQLQAEHVEEDVYDNYKPVKPYKDTYVGRRRDEGGLSDTDNMIHTVTSTVNGMELFVKNITRGHPNVYKTGETVPNNYLAGIIEKGRGSGRFMTNKDGTQAGYLQARPFISNTIRELERSLRHIDWYINGMKQHGINIDD